MIISGRRADLVIEGVFDGKAGVQGNQLAFVPNRGGANPASVKGGTLDGSPIRLVSRRDASGLFWTARFEDFA